MAFSGEDVQARVNLCRIGSNFYQGQTLNGKTFGYGTLFDKNHEQFIIGVFNENQLIEVQIAQFLNRTSCCNIRKFKDYYFFECEKESFLAQISVVCSNIIISDSFDKIFKDICLGSKLLKIYEDELSSNIIDFCNDFERTLVNVDWIKSDDNKSFEMFDFYQLLTQCSTNNDSFELIKKLGSTPVIFGDMSHKRAAINNAIVRRNQIFKFSNTMFKVDLFELLKCILKKVCANYRSCLLKQNYLFLQPYIETLTFPSIFLIRLSDMTTFKDSNQMAMKYRIPFDIANVFEIINRKPREIDEMGVPVIMKCYPDLLKAVGTELTLLSEELQIPYDTLYDTLITHGNTIQIDGDTLIYNLRKVQISFLRELLDYYKPGESLKKKLYTGPHEDYSIHSPTIKSKTIRYEFSTCSLIMCSP